MKHIEKIKILYEKYLNRTASRKEVEELFSLLRNRSQFKHLHNMMENEWERTDIDFSLEDLSWEHVRSNLKQGQDVDKIPVNGRNNQQTWMTDIRRIAAVAAGLFITGIAIWMWTRTDSKVYKTGFGETMEIVLSDGSHVLLNANSKITWNTNWENTRERTLTLEGEAFFEVSHQYLKERNPSSSRMDSSQRMPFQVITSDLSVNVLGTSFNVASRRQKTDVFLKSGEVLLIANPRVPHSQNGVIVPVQKGSRNDMDSIYLTPGDHVTYSGITRAIERHEEILPGKETSWIDGYLVYENEKLKTVLQELKDIYGKTFIMEDTTMLGRQVDLGLPYRDWNTVSELMSLSLEIEMEEKDNRIIIKKMEK